MVSSFLPTRLSDTGNFTGASEEAKTDTTQFKLAQIPTRSPATFTAIIFSGLEPWGSFLFGNPCFTCQPNTPFLFIQDVFSPSGWLKLPRHDCSDFAAVPDAAAPTYFRNGMPSSLSNSRPSSSVGAVVTTVTFSPRVSLTLS